MQAEIAVGGRTVMILSVFSFQGRGREGRREDRGARFDDGSSLLTMNLTSV